MDYKPFKMKGFPMMTGTALHQEAYKETRRVKRRRNKNRIAQNELSRLEDNLKKLTDKYGENPSDAQKDRLADLRFRIQKARAEQDAQQPTKKKEVPQRQQAPKVEDLDPKLQTWMKSNTWFGTDMVMTGAAQGLHQQLVGSEGFDPTSDEYYAEIDKRMRDSFPNKFQDKRQNAQAVAPATSNGRAVKSGRKKTVELSPGQVAFAKKMNIPLERYAKEVAKIESRRK